MIIATENNNDVKKEPLATSSAPAPPSESEATADDPPPTYTPAATSQTRPVSPPNLKATNFVSISRTNGSVKGEWLIDPSIILPPPFLPVLQSDETEATRRSIFLKSSNGVIQANVTIAPRLAKEPKGQQKVRMAARSSNGSLTFNLRDASSEASGSARLPVKLELFSSNGAIHVQIPRSFNGTVVSHTHNGTTKFSGEVRSRFQNLEQEDRGIVRTFIGDFTASDWNDGATWHGDELITESRNGSINIQFNDENAAKADDKGKSTGFFARLFGNF